MKIAARVENEAGKHLVTVTTNGTPQAIAIPARASGRGSAVNGGELLFAALATCYCNDIFREATKRGIEIERVDIRVEGEFGGEGEPAHDVVYHAAVTARATDDEIRDLMQFTDGVAEIQKSLRLGTPIVLATIEATPSAD